MSQSRAVNLAAFLHTVRRHRRWILQAGILGLVLGMAPVWAQRRAGNALKSRITSSRRSCFLPSTFDAKARIDVMPNSDLTALTFELHSNLRVEKVVDAAGQDVSFKQDGQSLNLSLLNPLPANNWLPSPSLMAECSIPPMAARWTASKWPILAPTGSYLLYVGRWFPVSAYSVNRFTATMSITVPSDEAVIASGKVSSPERELGKVTYTYTYDKPSFPGTVFAGPLRGAARHGRRRRHGDLPEARPRESRRPYGDTAARILTFYSDVFGPLPKAHLTLVEIADDTVGGYTAPGLVTLASRGFTNPVNYRCWLRSFRTCGGDAW